MALAQGLVEGLGEGGTAPRRLRRHDVDVADDGHEAGVDARGHRDRDDRRDLLLGAGTGDDGDPRAGPDQVGEPDRVVVERVDREEPGLLERRPRVEAPASGSCCAARTGRQLVGDGLPRGGPEVLAGRRTPTRRRSPPGPRGPRRPRPPTAAPARRSPARCRRLGGRARPCARPPPRRRRGRAVTRTGTSVSRSVTAYSALRSMYSRVVVELVLEAAVLVPGLGDVVLDGVDPVLEAVDHGAVDVGRADDHADRDGEEDGRDRHDVEPERDHASPRWDTVRTGP